MLIPFGVFSAAGAGGGGGGAGSYELIETTILGSDAASTTFSSIPSTYKHLQIRMVAQSTDGNLSAFVAMNGDSGSNYARHRLQGDGSTVASFAAANQTRAQFAIISNRADNANAPGSAVLDILDYQGTKNKTIRSLFGNTTSGTNFVGLGSGVWLSTSTITSLTISATTSFASGSRFSLYGIKG